MGDSGADLTLDVIADDRNATVDESLLPILGFGDEDGNTVHERAAGFEDLLDVPLSRHFGADREIRDHDVGFGVAKDAGDVGGSAGRFGNDLGQILTKAVVRHSAQHRYVQVGDVGEFDRVV